MWCSNPEETAEFMKGVEKPWIAFKVWPPGRSHRGRLPLRLQKRGRFRSGGDVRLRDRRRREDRQGKPGRPAPAGAALERLNPKEPFS